MASAGANGPALYFDDFPVGIRREIGRHRVTEEEIVRFAREFDPQLFHVDREAAEASPFGGLIASGWHTCALVMRMMCDGFVLDTASLGSPGVDELRWRKPVRPDDTLALYTTVTEARPSASKPDRGILINELELENQHAEIVLTMRAMLFVARRSERSAERAGA